MEVPGSNLGTEAVYLYKGVFMVFLVRPEMPEK
jgi:hypothetical protein